MKFNLLRPFSKIVGRTQPFVNVITSDETSGLPIIRPKQKQYRNFYSKNAESLKQRKACHSHEGHSHANLLHYVRGIIYYRFVSLEPSTFKFGDIYSSAFIE
jgi:hypothetical protein